jgi:NAD(P)-dependent dehydrogenase (short-subunit alcohol dehydrogenase family)
MTGKLGGKVAVITGGGAGIGLASAMTQLGHRQGHSTTRNRNPPGIWFEPSRKQRP